MVGERHLKLRLAKDGAEYEAMLFAHIAPLPDACARYIVRRQRIQRRADTAAHHRALAAGLGATSCIISAFRIDSAMEAEQLNAIARRLQDLAAQRRLRRYL